MGKVACAQDGRRLADHLEGTDQPPVNAPGQRQALKEYE